MARITLVSRNFPPLTGGMERLVFELYRGLLAHHELTLLGPKGCDTYLAAESRVRSARISPTPCFLVSILAKGFLSHRDAPPDVVIGGSGLVAPVVIALAKAKGAKSVLLLHGLDLVADSRLYQSAWLPLIRRADLLVCNSRNTARLATHRGVSQQKLVICNPGVDVAARSSHEAAKSALGLEGRKVLLSVGRLTPRKGLVEFIDHVFLDLARSDPEWLLLIAGGEPSQALNRSRHSVTAAIEARVAEHGLESQLRLLGYTDDDQLPELYAAADVFVFPLIDVPGDVEGFGMVAIEAAAQGTPTVAFDCGGVSDAVEDEVSGAVVRPGDYAAFTAAIHRVSNSDLRDSARRFAERFSWDHYAAAIGRCLSGILES